MKRARIRNRPMNRNFSDDPMVVGKISVDSEERTFREIPEKKVSTKKIAAKKSGLQPEDLLLIGLILIFLQTRNASDEEMPEPESVLSLDRIRKMLPFDRFPENEILPALLLYLLF